MSKGKLTLKESSHNSRIASITGCLLSACMIVGTTSVAGESVEQKARESMSEANKKAKKAYRSAKDEACEMVNGKLQCAGAKMKHKMENLKDEVESK